MICGNDASSEIVKKIFNLIEKNKVDSNFVLLSWPSNVGKSTLVRKLSKNILKDFYDNDFLFVKDLSYYLWKKHSLKVDVWEKDRKIDIPNVWSFYDMWSRQIIDWCHKSANSWKKIILLENIERMSNSAANSLLKLFEEPPKQTFIFATTENKFSIISTIYSRAFIVNFYSLNYEEVVCYLESDFPDTDKRKLELAAKFSLGRFGFAKKLLKSTADLNFEDIESYFERFVNLLNYSWNYSEKYKILENIKKSWWIMIFFDILAYHFSIKKQFDRLEHIFYARRLIEWNVSYENVFLDFLLNIDNVEKKV